MVKKKTQKQPVDMSAEHDDRSLHSSTNKPSPVIMKTMGLNKEGFL